MRLECSETSGGGDEEWPWRVLAGRGVPWLWLLDLWWSGLAKDKKGLLE